MAFIVKFLGTTASVVAVGSALVAFDVKRKQLYECQPFQEALKQYIKIYHWRILGYLYKKKLEVASRDVCKAQEEFLLAQLKENCCTEYGKLFNFSKMRNICDFRKCHPITRYDHYKPFIDKMMNGEANIMTKTMPILFASTAGTSGVKKAIPVVQRQSDIFYNEGVSLMVNSMVQCLNCASREKLYKELCFFHNPYWKMTKAGVKMGPFYPFPDEMLKLMYMFTTPGTVVGLRQEQEALYIHLLFALHDCHLAIMDATYANTILYAFKMLEFDRPKLIKDLSNGTLNPKLDLRCDTRRCLEAMLKANCERAKVVQQAFECGSDGLAVRMWPNLQMVVCVDSGPFAFYGDELRNTFLKGVNIYSPLYTAAEGLMGVNIWPKNLPTRYILSPRAMFFELIPLEKMKEEQPETVLLGQAEAGELYEVVITNASGLYRYRMGDVIRVCGFHHEAPIIEFMYRETQVLNISNEQMTENTFYEALSLALKEWEGFRLVDYVTVPSTAVKSIVNQSKDPRVREKFFLDKVCYLLFMEPNGPFTNPTQEQIEILEKYLAEKCPAYGALRMKGTLGEVHVQLVNPGSFVQMRELLNEINVTTSDQYKTLRVLTSPDAIELLLKKSL